MDDLNIYYSYIPDKDVYASKDYPGFDTDIVLTTLTEELPELTLIDLADTLSAEDFYRTDLHWDQVKLGNVVDRIGATMGFNVDLSSFQSVNAGEFHGVYTGQIALPVGNDEMVCLVPGDSVSARYLNEKSFEWEDGAMYDIEAFSGRDPSLAPLLAQTYRKITLIDLRYIDYSYLADFISFEKGSDAMFLYSSQVLNNPGALLVK